MKSNEDSLAQMKGAFDDLWLDTEERPRMRREINQVRKLIVRHLGISAAKTFDMLQRSVDKGLRADALEEIVIPAMDALGKLHGLLFAAIFGSSK